MIKKLLLSLVSILISLGSLFSGTCTSGTGTYVSWLATVWTCTGIPAAGPPGCSDAIVISGTIKMSADVDLSACPAPMVITIKSTGTLDFNTNGVSLKLPAGSSIVIEAGGKIIKTFAGGGASTLITTGTGGSSVILWTAGFGTVSGPLLLGPSPLPIELLSFDAKQNLSRVDLRWSTASEKNNDYFTIEKTKDGYSFETVGIIDGTGNSSSLIDYATIDNSPYNGQSYYRLKQTDFDGKFSYSNLRMVDFMAAEVTFDIFPNPSDGSSINVSLSANEGEEILIVVYDITGKESYSKVIITQDNAKNVYAIDTQHNLAPGIYLISATSKQSIYNKKLIVE